jgi:RNA polymerase sigma-70 factor, ECF subfamily
VGPLPEPDRRARFERLAREVYEPVQRFLLRRCDPATADDVLGDTLLVVWRRLDDVPADAALPWVYGVARGCLANAHRSAARQQRLVLRLMREPAPDTAPDTHADAGLSEALAALPEGDRELLRLWAWEQLAPREIAVALGISANAAAIRLHRAKKRLRAELTAGKDRGPAGHEGVREGGRAR